MSAAGYLFKNQEIVKIMSDSVCKQCGRILTKDEIGLHKKLYNRAASSYFCIDCSSRYLEVPVAMLEKKIEEFKAMGCTLFIP